MLKKKPRKLYVPLALYAHIQSESNLLYLDSSENFTSSTVFIALISRKTVCLVHTVLREIKAKAKVSSLVSSNEMCCSKYTLNFTRI